MYHYGTGLEIPKTHARPQSRQPTPDQEINLTKHNAQVSTNQSQCSVDVLGRILSVEIPDSLC